MKRKWFVCALCMLSVGFMSCSDDDEEENAGVGGSGGGSDAPAMEAPAVNGAGIQFPVTYVNNGYESTYYRYENGRMVQGWGAYEPGFLVTSNPLIVKGGDEDNSYTFQNIRLNNSGFITSCELTGTEGDSYTYKASLSCSYDEDGHLVLEKGTYLDNEGGKEEYTATYVWNNGNLVRHEENNMDVEDGEVEYGRYVCEMEYAGNKYPNSGVFFEIDVMGGGAAFDGFFFYAGVMGRYSKNIPSKVTIIDYVENAEESCTFVTDVTGVEYNDNGSVKAVNTMYDGSSRIYQYGYDPVAPSRSAVNAPVVGEKKMPRVLRRLCEKRMK